MNKAELVDAMAEGAGISKADAKRALDAFVDATAGALGKGDRVSLVGFGSFSVSHRAERQGRNPQTGKTITIAAKNVIKFKAGAELSSKGIRHLALTEQGLEHRARGLFVSPQS